MSLHPNFPYSPYEPLIPVHHWFPADEMSCNLSESEVAKTPYDAFKAAINVLILQQTGTTHIEASIRLQETRTFRTDHCPILTASKSIFTKIVGEPQSGGFELSFAAFSESAKDVAVFAKN